MACPAQEQSLAENTSWPEPIAAMLTGPPDDSAGRSCSVGLGRDPGTTPVWASRPTTKEEVNRS
jgi:hypothetical protein